MDRPQWTSDDIEKAHNDVAHKLRVRLQQKGPGAFVSHHEILGILAEEHLELVEAVKADSKQSVYDELLDIAVTAILGLASLSRKERD